MAKKITVKMLKEGKIPSDEELNEIFNSVAEAAKKMTVVNKKDFAPLTVEDDLEFVAGLGFGTLALFKKVSTPAAWNYIVNSMRKAMKE